MLCIQLCKQPILNWLSASLHDVLLVDVIWEDKYRSDTSIDIILGTCDIMSVNVIASTLCSVTLYATHFDVPLWAQ